MAEAFQRTSLEATQLAEANWEGTVEGSAEGSAERIVAVFQAPQPVVAFLV